MEVSSFSSRRPAAGALPAFTLPPPNSDVPRSTADGLSPSLSSVHTTSSQASQSNMQYTYQQNSQQGWSNSSTSPYGPQSHHSQPPSHQSQQNAFGPRTTGMYPHNPMSFPNQRSSQSPATGAEGLPAPPMDHSSYQVSGHDAHSSMTSAAPSHAAIMSPTQPHTPSSGGQMEYSYTSRGPSNASYYTASPAHPQGGFSTYGAHQSPPLPSPTGGHDSRGLPGQSMGSYRYPYNSVGMGAGPVMSNIHQPGGQMSMIPGMGVGQNYGGQHMMYGHHGHQPAAQSERPFKCDQCVQSFSRNHDLKRHKRIHLAVKPFPCNFCSKSFSRKDALKRHRLVKGCEAKSSEGGNADESQDRNGGPNSVSGGSEQAPRPAM